MAKRERKTEGRAEIARALRQAAERIHAEAGKIGPALSRSKDAACEAAIRHAADAAEVIYGIAVRMSLGITDMEPRPGEAAMQPLFPDDTGERRKWWTEVGAKSLTLPYQIAAQLERDGLDTVGKIVATDLGQVEGLTEAEERTVRRAVEEYLEGELRWFESLSGGNMMTGAEKIRAAIARVHVSPPPPVMTRRPPAKCRMCGWVDYLYLKKAKWAEEDLCQKCADNPPIEGGTITVTEEIPAEGWDVGPVFPEPEEDTKILAEPGHQWSQVEVPEDEIGENGRVEYEDDDQADEHELLIRDDNGTPSYARVRGTAAQAERAARNVEKAGIHTVTVRPVEKAGPPTGPPAETWASLTVDELDLKTYQVDALVNGGIKTLGDLSQDEGDNVKGLDRKDWLTISEKLQKFLSERKRAKIESGDAVAEELQAALFCTPNAKEYWNRARKAGLNDGDLKKAISFIFGELQTDTGPDRAGHTRKGGGIPSLWVGFGASKGRKPDLTAGALIARVRAMLQIPKPARAKAQPQPQAQP